MRIQFRDVAGTRMRLAFGGTGYPLLMIHGLGVQAERWINTIEGLPDGLRAIVPDLVNNGFTDDADFSTEAPQRRHVRQMADLLDDLGVRKCAVMGSSYGGLIAGLLALERPECVSQLIIVGSGSALHSPERQVDVLRAVKANAMKAIVDGTLGACRARMAVTAWQGHHVSEAMLPALLTANALPGRRESAERFYDALVRSADVPECMTWPRLEQIACPTLIVTGRNDIRASWEAAMAAQVRIPNSRLEIFEDCGHGPMVEHPERFNALIGEFLTPLRSALGQQLSGTAPLHH